MTLRNAAKSASSNTMKVWIAVLSVVLALMIAGFCVRDEYRQNILPQWMHHTAETAPEADGDHTTTVVMLDGELAWQYDVGYGNDESVRYVMRERIDAVELTPAYLRVITEIEEHVAARMKAEGIQGFGSCHAFWHVKQELLKGKGIIWRTPTEMNPDTCYD